MYNELYHHGVKGQQWGVRNGPPYPIEDKVLRKGTRLNSVSSFKPSSDYMNSGRWMYTYRPEDKWDRAIYTGPFATYLTIRRGAKYIKEHEFETVRDLKMPTKSERLKEFSDLLEDKKYKKIVKQDLDKYKKILVKYKIGTEEEQKRYKNFNPNKSIKTKEDLKTAYEIFNQAIGHAHSNKSTQEYARRMSEKFDAMVDDNNQGIYNNAHDPIIVFKAHQVLKEVQDRHKTIQGWATMPDGRKISVTGVLSRDDVSSSFSKVKDELSKIGMKVQL